MICRDDPRRVIENTLVPHTAFNRAIKSLDQCFEYAHGCSEPVCLALLGESRTGKSRALEECYVKHPRYRTPEGMTIPIVRVKTPSKPTVKGLVEIMLHDMGDPRSSNGTENRKTTRLLELMCSASTRMLMVDEFQHFYDKVSHKVMHHVADWLKIVVDEAKIALVVSGIPTCRAVLDQNEQLAGRFLAPISMPRFNWNSDDQREEFEAILAAFHESMSQHFDLPELDGEGMSFRFYCGTGGLIGYLVKMLRQAVWDAFDENRKVITLADLADAHQRSVWAIDGVADIRPFDLSASLEPNERLLSMVTQVGLKVEESVSRQRASPRKKWKPSQILSAQ